MNNVFDFDIQPGLIELESGLVARRRLPAPEMGDLVMAIPRWNCYGYHTILHADHNGDWAGVADEDGSASLLGSRPSVVVTSGRVTMTRRWHAILNRSQASRAS